MKNTVSWQNAIVLLLAALAAALLPGPALALDVPPLSGRVNDLAGILSPEIEARLDADLARLEEQDGTQIAVLTIQSLAGEELERFSLRVASAWGLGQKGKDNGALLLVAVKEHDIRIEVGYGLEDKLTDMTSGQIIRHAIVPAFRAGDFNAGVERGVAAMIQAVHGEYQPPEKLADTGGPAQPGSESGNIELDAPLGALLVLVPLVATCCRRRPWLPPLAGAVTGFLVWLGFRDAVASPWGLVFLGSFCSGLLAWLISWVADLPEGTAGGGGSSRNRDSDDRSWRSSSNDRFSGGGGSFGGGGASGKW